MANLDDFFAKKDKKKGKKGGFSKANTDVLAKNLEENERREAKAEEKAAPLLATSEAAKAAFESSPVDGAVIGGTAAQQQAAGGGAAAANGQGKDEAKEIPGGLAGLADRANTKYFGVVNDATNDDEWLDYENSKKDYTGLKIEAIKIDDREGKDKNGSDADTHHEILNEDGEKVLVPKKGDGGPWKKAVGQSRTPEPKDDDSVKSDSSSNATTSATAAAVEKNLGGAVVGGSYVPPHMRGSAAAAAGGSRDSPAAGGPSLSRVRLGGGGGGRQRAAPNINSEVNFPSLGAANAAVDVDSKGGRDDFHEVRSGGGANRGGATAAARPQLALGNKFAALRD